MRTKTEIFEEKGVSYEEAEVKQLGGQFEFTEGPVWHPSGYLLFSDTPANRIYRMSESGETEVFLEKSGWSGEGKELLSDQVGSNALAFDKTGQLLICQHGNHGIASWDGENDPELLISEFEQKPFNSPNDIAVRSDGVIYFTDPPYGLKDQVLHKERFQKVGGLYCYRNGKIDLLSADLKFPNGLAFSNDEKYLYLGSNHPDEPRFYRYTLTPKGGITERRILARQNGDGMVVDANGNILFATDEGILVLSPAGQRLALISLAETPTNICKGAVEEQFFITARTAVFQLLLPSLGK